MHSGEAEHVVLSQGWLAHQPPAFQAAVLGRARLASFAEGEHVFDVGDQHRGVYGVVQGAVAVYVPDRGANLRLGHIARGGDWIGHWQVLTGRRRILIFRVREPMIAFQVPFSALNEIAAEDRVWTRSASSLMDFTVDIAVAAVGDLLIPDPGRRLAATMLRAAGLDMDGRLAKPIRLRLAASELGEMANVSQDSVSGILARFNSAGWIAVGDKQVTIADPKALAAFAGEER